uniref:Arachidonate 12-lipoxygenase, 12S type n=1 Tax=Canis lupus familiaris TaxID=9615 RepID=A0A8C0MU98_CANLF
MGKYTIRVVTGDSLLAGSCNQVQLWLVGEHWEADLGQKLRPMRRGVSAPSSKSAPLHLGRLPLVKLRKDEHLGDFDWFCKWISVRGPGTNGEALFPCYCWVQGSGIVCLPEGTGEGGGATDDQSLFKTHREQEIQKRKRMWGSWKDGLILPVAGRTPWDLPKNERFQEDKDFDFSFSLAKVGGLGPQGDTNPVKRPEDFKRIFPSAKTALDDALFGYQFLSAWLVLPPGMEDLKTQLEKELQVLYGVKLNVIILKQQYVAAPLVMLKLQPDGKLLPMVIQLQPPHHGCPTPMLPSNPPMAWLLAKTWVRSSDFQMHQLQSHLLRGHLMAEVISVATMRTLPSLHPIYKGVSTSSGGHVDILQRATACLTYHSLCPLADLADRQDALRLWGIISRRYVEGMVGLFYMTDEAVRDDPELQAWCREITETGLQGARDRGFPVSLDTRVQLCHFVTMCIFMCPGQHASAHLGQLDWYSWIPNGPCTMRKPPPVSKDVTEKDIMDSLPTAHQAHMQKTFTKFLGRRQPIMVALGQHKERYFSGPRPQAVAAVDQEIEARNAGLQLPYEYLRPSMVENSVTI